MREIKFRVWDFQNLRFAKQHEIGLSIGLEFGVNDYFIINQGEKKIRWAFMQYTGLKDKNGKEIYEGDIVEHYHVGNHLKSVIYWDVAKAMFCLKYGDKINPHHLNPSKYTVVGNIYENPELLKYI